MTLTIEIPDALGEHVSALPDDERAYFDKVAVDAVVSAWQSIGVEEDDPIEFTDEDIAAIQEGIDDAEAGRCITLEEFRDRMFGEGSDPASVIAGARARMAAHEVEKQSDKAQPA